MGFTARDKMMPFVIFKIFYKYTDKNHKITMKKLCRLVSEYYQGRYKSETELAKTIAKNITYINEFFEMERESRVCENEFKIVKVSVANQNARRGHIYLYYMEGKILSGIEFKVLTDSIVFAPGVPIQEVTTLLTKVKCLSGSLDPMNWQRLIEYKDIIKRTNKENLYQYLEVIGEAIEKRNKICCVYKRFEADIGKVNFISPYHLVVSGGRYYLICNVDGKDTIAIYRVDRMIDVNLVEDSVIRNINSIPETGGHFDLATYMREHPRMTYEKAIYVVMVVPEELVDAIENEFQVSSKTDVDECQYRVKIYSAKTAISNWILNLADKIYIEYTSDDTLINDLTVKAKKIMDNFSQKACFAN